MFNMWLFSKISKNSGSIDLDSVVEIFRSPGQCDKEVRDSFTLAFCQHPVLT